MEVWDALKLAALIDHTCLKPDATKNDIEQLCQEALTYHFHSVCVNSGWVGFCAKLLKGSDVRICSTVGFPLGAMHPLAKRFEAVQAVEEGATEIDMVINLGGLKAKEKSRVANEIQMVAEACSPGILKKIIIETCLLTEEEKILACRLVKESKVEFIKTSTGFAGQGATAEDVALLKSLIGAGQQVKASGGIRRLEQALIMIKAGASRLGTSASVALIKEIDVK